MENIWGSDTYPERAIASVILAVDEQGNTCQAYTVGVGGVTEIRRVKISGEMAYLPYLQIWKGKDLSAEISQHKVAEVLFKVPNELVAPRDTLDLPF